MTSTWRAVLGVAAAILCSCVHQRNGFHVDVEVVGTPEAFRDRVVEVEGVTAPSISPGGVAVALCTTDAAAFRTKPVRVRVIERGSVVSETVLDRRACRDVQHARFDGFVERVTLVLQPDGSLASPSPARTFVNVTDYDRTRRGDETASGILLARELPSPGALREPSASCSGPSPAVRMLFGVYALDRYKCGGREPCTRRELGSATARDGSPAAPPAFARCGP